MHDKKSVHVKIARAITDLFDATLSFEEGLTLGEDKRLVQSIMFDLVTFVAAHRRKVQNGKKNQ